MRKLQLSDVKNLHEYELIRDDWRRDVIAAKARRRVVLGPKMSLVFENRLTVLNQIQEMCRAERLAKPDQVQNEIDVFNELIPGAGELSATLFVEIEGVENVKPELDRLVGLSVPGRVRLEMDGRPVAAAFDARQGRDDRISAVQYLKFPVGSDDASRRTLAAGPVRVVVDHPAYRASAELSPETREEIARDLLPD